MLFGLLMLVVLASALLSKRLCARASAARVYGSLLGALMLSGSITGVRLLQHFVALHEVNVWQITAIVFQNACFAFPALFLCSYPVFISMRRQRTGPESAFPYLASTAMLSVGLGLLAIGVYASRVEPNLIEVTHTDLRTPYLKPRSPPLKIVQLSDLHIEKFGYRERRVLSIVERLKPDIIVLTGDCTNVWERYPHVQRFLKGLHAKYGVYAVHGNWDPMPKAAKFFEGTDIQVLEGESRVIRTQSGRVVIAGIPWDSAEEAGAPLARVDTRDSYVILLSHMPDAALHTPKSVDLVLAGNTHGGQVRFPLIGPLVTFTDVGRDRCAGLSRLAGGGWLYVNRGLGMEGGAAPRIRFLCRPEIAVFTIRPEEER